MIQLLNSTRLGDKFVSVKNKTKEVIIFDKKSVNVLFQDLKSKKFMKLNIKDFYRNYQKAC